MSNFNRVLLMGRLTRDIELKQVTGGHTFYIEEWGLEPGDLVSY